VVATLLSVNNYLYRRGGAEVVFHAHNALLEQEGWTVLPFCMKHSRNPRSEWEDFFVDEIELAEPYPPLTRMAKGLKAIYSVEARRKVKRLIARERPDLCHAHNVYHHISPAVLGAVRAHGIPIVMTLHDLKLACPAYTMLSHDGVCERCRDAGPYQVAVQRCMKGSLPLSLWAMVESYVHRMLDSYRRNVDVFVAPSRFYVQKLREWGFGDLDLRYVPNFVDTSGIVAASTAGERFLYFGRLSKEKGIATLVRAAAEAGVGLDVAGAGPQREELEALAARLDADVRFLGHLDAGRLESVLAAARAVVLPSEWYENAPLSVLEAYAHGKPVIVADIGGVPELVRRGETGFTFVSGSVEGLATVLRRTSDLPDADVEAMGRQGREFVESEFSPTRYREGIETIYRGLGVA
jgi:glycosyltransferase involved in cell wall biosynthesis